MGRAAGIGLRAPHRLALLRYGISNLVSLEKLGVTRRVGELELEDLYFALAGSVMNAVGAAVVCFEGRVTVQLTHVEPIVSRAQSSA